MMTNAEIRQWYLSQVAVIPKLNEEWIQQGLSARQRAESSWFIRHKARLEARKMMANPAEVELLQARDMAKYANPNGPTFQHLVEQAKAVGLEADAIYEVIIACSYKTDKGVNKSFGF